MSHWWHRGWGRLPYSRMITVSQTCLCRKYTPIYLLIAARPLHPLTGNSCGLAAGRHEIQYVWRDPSVFGVSHWFLPPASRHLWVCRFTDSDHAVMSLQQPIHCTLTFCLARYVSSSPIIHSLYAAYDWVPATEKGRLIIPTFFPTFVRSPNLLNNPVRVLNAPLQPDWVHRCGHTIVCI